MPFGAGSGTDGVARVVTKRLAEDLSRLYTRNTQDQMVPLANVITTRNVVGPQRVPRYNLYPAAEIAGEIRPGYGSAAAIAVENNLTHLLNVPEVVHSLCNVQRY